MHNSTTPSVNDLPCARKRRQSAGEKIANSVSHGAGFVGAAIGTPFLLQEVARNGGVADLAGAAVFVTTVMLAYLASTLYHAAPWPRVLLGPLARPGPGAAAIPVGISPYSGSPAVS